LRKATVAAIPIRKATTVSIMYMKQFVISMLVVVHEMAGAELALIAQQAITTSPPLPTVPSATLHHQDLETVLGLGRLSGTADNLRCRISPP
jgi:hypothetical protein